MSELSKFIDFRVWYLNVLSFVVLIININSNLCRFVRVGGECK